MKQLFAFVALVCAFMVPANNTVWAADSKHPARILIERSISKVQRALSSPNPINTETLIRHYVTPHFNFYKMSKWVIGKKKWKNASRDQRKRFTKAFESLLTRTYKTALNKAVGQKFKVQYYKVRAKSGARYVRVKTKVIQGGQKIRVDYKMYLQRYKYKGKLRERWMAYNVYVEGASLLATYRNDFKKVDIEDAIAQLNSKNQGAN